MTTAEVKPPRRRPCGCGRARTQAQRDALARRDALRIARASAEILRDARPDADLKSPR